MWFNHYQEFEKKQSRENRLVLGIYNLKTRQKAKIFTNKYVKIPSNFVHPDNKDLAKKIVKQWKENFSKYPLTLFIAKNMEKMAEATEKKYGLRVFPNNINYHVFNIELPNDRKLLTELKYFQKGSYLKFLRLGGFYPERKLNLEPVLEDAIRLAQLGQNREKEVGSLVKRLDRKNYFHYNQESKEYEIFLNSRDDKISGINFLNEFLTEQELDSLPSLIIDLEKPIFKKRPEKNLLDERKKILRELKKQDVVERRLELEEIEKKLIYKSSIGPIELYDDLFDAKISWATTEWKNIGNGNNLIRELDVLDPNDEFEHDEINGYKVIRHKTEKDLIIDLRKRAIERGVIVGYGHNETYDWIQLREAFRKLKTGKFDVAVPDIEPVRDFVLKVCQRLKEDMIYIDTFFLNKFFFPYLRSKFPEGSHKLEDVSTYHGLPMKKTLSHEQLRDVEITRLASKDKKQRQETALKLAQYATDDVYPVRYMTEKLPFRSFLCKMKRVMPYATIPELAFSPRIIDKHLDFKHFEKCHNQRLFGRAAKEHHHKIEIFKKRENAIRKEQLEKAGIYVSNVFYEKAHQLYFPLEAHIRDITFVIYPEFKQLCQETEKDPIEYFAYQMLEKARDKDMHMEAYFCRKEHDVFLSALGRRNIELVCGWEKNASKKSLDRLIALFENLKDHYRSIYVSLDAEHRALIRSRKGEDKAEQFEFDYEELFKVDNRDLYLLKAYAKDVRFLLSDKNDKILSMFLTNFSRYEETIREVREYVPRIKNLIPEDVLYLYILKERDSKNYNIFKAKHGIAPYARNQEDSLEKRIEKAFSSLATDLKSMNAIPFLIRGDYFFVASEKNREEVEKKIKDSKLIYIREIHEHKKTKKDSRQITFE